MNALMLALLLSQTAPILVPADTAPVVDSTPTVAPTVATPERIKRPTAALLASGISLLALGEIASVGATVSAWSTINTSRYGGYVVLLAPFGVIWSAVPVVGPISAMAIELGDMARPEYAAGASLRFAINAAALLAQGIGLPLLIIGAKNSIQNTRDERRERIRIKSLGAAPSNGGAQLLLSGSF